MTEVQQAVRAVSDATDQALTALKTLGETENRLTKILAKGIDGDTETVSRLTRQAMTELPNDLWTTVLGALEKYRKTMTALDEVLNQ